MRLHIVEECTRVVFLFSLLRTVLFSKLNYGLNSGDTLQVLFISGFRSDEEIDADLGHLAGNAGRTALPL